MGSKEESKAWTTKEEWDFHKNFRFGQQPTKQKMDNTIEIEKLQRHLAKLEETNNRVDTIHIFPGNIGWSPDVFIEDSQNVPFMIGAMKEWLKKRIKELEQQL